MQLLFFPTIILLWLQLLLLLTDNRVWAYQHTSCSPSIARQFQFDDCYLPPLNPKLLLTEASFLLSHDAATGYLSSAHHYAKGSDNAAVHLYAKNQIGSVYQQLDDGARALDIRPKLAVVEERVDGNDNDDNDGRQTTTTTTTVACHHGAIGIDITLERVVQDALAWCRDNPDELVLIVHHNLSYPSNGDISPSAGTAVKALSSVYQALGVTYVECNDLYGLTVGETMELAALSDGGGYLLAMDQHDAYSTSCAKQNYVENQLVTCYTNKQGIPPCTTTPPPNRNGQDTGTAKFPSLAALQDYVLQSANNGPTNDGNTLGPPANDYTYLPLNEIQALWQVDAVSAALGVAHVSSLLDDNTKSHLNAHIVQWVYSGKFQAVSLLAVDQVRLNGNALLSVLRNQCGQQQDGDSGETRLPCGTALPPPKMQRHSPMSTLSFAATLIACSILAVWMWLLYAWYRRNFQYQKELQRLQGDLTQSYVSMVEATHFQGFDIPALCGGKEGDDIPKGR